MIKNTNTNKKRMSNFNNGAQVGSKAVNVRSIESINNNNRDSEKREELNLAVKASRDIKGLFRVEYGTIAKRIRESKNGKRPLGVVAHGRHRMANGQSFNVYIKVEEKVIDGYSNYVVYVEAGNGKWVMNGLETEVVKVDYHVGGWSHEKALTEAIGAAFLRYIDRYFDAVDSAEEEAVEETAKETDNGYWDSVVAQTEEYLTGRLEECGMNALKLADALVEAYQHTDGAVYYGDVPTLALWVNFKGKIVSRLESLGDGAQTPAPCLKEEKPAETPNDNSGNPAPGLREQVEDMLTADWAQMGDSPLEGYIGEHRMGGRYILETTRELWADPYMGVCLVRIGDGHEHFWRIYEEGDIHGVAEDLSKEIAQTPRTGLDNDLERVEKFLRELPNRIEELNYCEDEVKIDNGNLVVCASVDDDGEIYAHLEVSLYGEYDEGDEPIGDSWNWTINDDDDIAKCLDDIRGFFEGPDPAVEYLEKKNNYVIE